MLEIERARAYISYPLDSDDELTTRLSALKATRGIADCHPLLVFRPDIILNGEARNFQPSSSSRDRITSATELIDSTVSQRAFTSW